MCVFVCISVCVCVCALERAVSLHTLFDNLLFMLHHINVSTFTATLHLPELDSLIQLDSKRVRRATRFTTL